jgi:hypothetical protein
LAYREFINNIRAAERVTVDLNSGDRPALAARAWRWAGLPPKVQMREAA